MGVQPQPVGLRGGLWGKAPWRCGELLGRPPCLDKSVAPQGLVLEALGLASTLCSHRAKQQEATVEWEQCRKRDLSVLQMEMPSFGSGCPEPRPTQPSALPVQWERTEGGLFLQRWAAARACWERRGEKVALLLGTAAPANRNPLPSQMSGGTPMAMWGGGDGA